MENEDFSHLPDLLAEIAEVAGEVAAIQLARAKGGQQVYIPASLPERHWLIDAVGKDSAKAICAHFAVGTDRPRGERVQIPFGPINSDAQRKRKIAEMLGSGASVNQVVNTVRVDRRTVFRHKKRGAAGDNGQGSLF
ncbi:MAG: helix-turn-helix domain-containing protein [Pseudomonadota bacterium]